MRIFIAGPVRRSCDQDDLAGRVTTADSAATRSAVNEMSGDKRKIRADRPRSPVNGINESGTSPRTPAPAAQRSPGAGLAVTTAGGTLRGTVASWSGIRDATAFARSGRQPHGWQNPHHAVLSRREARGAAC